MSTQSCIIVKLDLQKHPDADNLSIQKVDNFQVICRTEDWINKGIEYGVYIPPDSVVNTDRSEFSFLKDPKKISSEVRIRAKRLRGIYSMGLMIPAPKDFNPEIEKERDFYKELEIKHYQPDEGGENIPDRGNIKKCPTGYEGLSKYDIENGRKSDYNRLFKIGELISISEKLHGQNCFITIVNDELCVKSRNFWKEKDEASLFWRAALADENIFKFLKDNPGYGLYGEQIGHIKGFKYDCKEGEVKFKCFDILKPDRSFINADDFITESTKYGLPTVPIIDIREFNIDNLCEEAEKDSCLNNRIREGIVIKPLVERFERNIGRLFIKIVNPKYLEMN